MSLEEMQTVINDGTIGLRPQTVTINIPLDPSQTGTVAIDTKLSDVDPFPGLEWIESCVPGTNMPTTHVGVRKGGMVTKDTYTARLALDTPYISLPNEIYDILIQATSPTPWQSDAGYDDVVDCDALHRFPDLVLGLEPETDEEEDDIEFLEEREIVITPKQYIIETEKGKCVLLAQRVYQKGHEEVVLGWAAVRGRHLVLDWVNERTAFGR